MRIKSLSELLRDCEWSEDNLRRIAISNLRSSERQLVRWWCDKYKIPQKPLMEHTLEEIAIEMLEDYYHDHPDVAKQFMESFEVEDWDGKMSPEYEAQIQKKLDRLNKKNGVDLAKYQNLDEKLSPEEEEMIIASLGRNLPKSKAQPQLNSDAGFDDDFLGGEA